MVRLPRHLISMMVKVTKVAQEYMSEHGRLVSNGKLAELVGINHEELARLLKVFSHLSSTHLDHSHEKSF